MNEAESKGAATLAFKGDADVPVKSNHGQSRQRASLCNMMSNDPSFAAPVEINFKLKTDRCLKTLVVPNGVLMTFSHTESGSYDLTAFLDYLRKVLPEWTPERAASHDYRLQGGVPETRMTVFCQ